MKIFERALNFLDRMATDFPRCLVANRELVASIGDDLIFWTSFPDDWDRTREDVLSRYHQLTDRDLTAEAAGVYVQNPLTGRMWDAYGNEPQAVAPDVHRAVILARVTHNTGWGLDRTTTTSISRDEFLDQLEQVRRRN